jgi:hypothetical protein
MRKFYTVLIILAALTSDLGAAEKKAKASIILAEPELRAQGCAQHRLVLENFPINREIIFATHRVLQEDPKVFTNTETIRLDEQGIIEIDKRVKTRFYGLDPSGYAPGERVKFRFEEQGRRLCEVSYIPRPLSVKSQDGTFTMEAELLTIAPTMWRLRFHGIQEGEIFSFISNSCGEILTGENPYRSCDIYTMSPDVIGEVGGNDEVTIRRKSGDQALLTLPWGAQIITNLEQERADWPPRSEPKITGGRLYMPVFSILLPDKFWGGTIDGRACDLLSTVTLSDDTSGDLAVIDALQTTAGPVSIEKCLEISKDSFFHWKKSSILRQVPTARVLHEEKWADNQRAGYFVLMEVPAGVGMIDESGEVVEKDVIRGYLVSFIDGRVVSICVQDNVFSFKWCDRYFSLEIIKNELLSQAADILKSYRTEQRVVAESVPTIPKRDA